MRSNFARRLKKETLQKRLAELTKDYQDLERDYKEAGDSDQRNRLQSKLDRKLEEIAQIETELKKNEQSEQQEKKQELISILQFFYLDSSLIVLLQEAYEITLPIRYISAYRKFAQNPAELISNFEFVQGENQDYSLLEEFVGNLWLLSRNVPEPTIEQLTIWIQENIRNSQSLIYKLERENQERKQRCNPGLLIGVTTEGNRYLVEAWLIKNIDQYHRECYSHCRPLKLEYPGQIVTDDRLSNVPELVKVLIEKCQTSIKQIHVFLPYKLMNHRVDCWQNWQQEENERMMGEYHQVIIRCSERLRGKNPSVKLWHQKGQKLRDNLNLPANQAFILGDSEEAKTLEKKLHLENAIAVKITTVFQQEQPGKLLWQSGVPVALWIREQLAHIDNQLELDQLLRDCCLQQLPEQVKNTRLDAMDCQPPENHVGRHLSLLWDDPSLLPPEQLLTEHQL